MKRTAFVALAFCMAIISHAQPMREITSTYVRAEVKQVKTAEELTIDGEFNEKAWESASALNDFFLKFPTDKGTPVRQTRVKVLYNDKFIYFAVHCLDSTEAYIQSLKRDIGHDGNDGIAIVLDPMNQKANGFWFVLNAYNAQTEGLLNGQAQIDMSWDNKWFSATKRDKTGWRAEIAIPFKTLRYQAGNTEWGINLVRIDTKSNQYSVWSRVPVNFKSYDIGYAGKMIFADAPKASTSNMSVIPYVIGGLNKDQENNTPLQKKLNAGFDAKVAMGSSLNLDLTVNPDFSQVEVDRQVTNLTRFNIFFPERRTFFLENADLFADYGYDGTRPFYSRRIGVDNAGNTVPIYGGARLTGNLGERTRIGVMNMQTGRKDDFAAQNYTAVSLKHRVQDRSSVNAYFLNRQGFMTEAEKGRDPLAAFGRNAGLEYSFTSKTGKWSAWNSWNMSMKPGMKGDNLFVSTGAQYAGRYWSVMQDFTTVGTNYYTDMGFMQRVENYDAARDTVIRLGYKHSFTSIERKWFPEKGMIAQQNLQFENYVVLNPDNSFNEMNQNLSFMASMRNTSMVNIQLNNNGVNLLYPISFTGGKPLPAGWYGYQSAQLTFSSDFRKSFSYTIGGGYGGFYNGTNRSVTAAIVYRNQPHVNIGLRGTYNNLKFPGDYGSTNLLLIAPQVEINFSTNIFWTTFIQYNSQRNNININSRFQWRFRPMSDIFLVYTDNYFTDPLMKNRSRGVVLKLNYWLNI